MLTICLHMEKGKTGHVSGATEGGSEEEARRKEGIVSRHELAECLFSGGTFGSVTAFVRAQLGGVSFDGTGEREGKPRMAVQPSNRPTCLTRHEPQDLPLPWGTRRDKNGPWSQPSGGSPATVTLWANKHLLSPHWNLIPSSLLLSPSLKLKEKILPILRLKKKQTEVQEIHLQKGIQVVRSRARSEPRTSQAPKR